MFDPRKNPEISSELYDLISTAYSEIGGHIKIKSPEDVLKDPDWNWWEGTDIHHTRDFDVLIFGEKTPYGVKFTGVGHDGSQDAKREYIKSRTRALLNPGYYIEVSGKLAEILLSRGVPEVDNPQEVEKVLGKPVDWIGTDSGKSGGGWYVRKIAGSPHKKIMLGRPKV